MKSIFCNINLIVIFIEIIFSLENNKIYTSRKIKGDYNSIRENLLKCFNSSQNEFTKFDEFLNNIEKMTQNKFEYIINKPINEDKSKKYFSIVFELSNILNEIKLYNEFMDMEKIDKNIYKINQIKNILEKKIEVFENLKNININLTNNSYIKKKDEKILNAKDCIEYGLSPYDENYIICTKYE